MKHGKYENKAVSARKSASIRSLALLLALVLLVGGGIGGTIAWLTDKTTEVKNTFSTSDISIELKETTTEYKMIPGWSITKDPYVTVTETSEDCYLFVKIDENLGAWKDNNVKDGTSERAPVFTDYLSYTVVTGEGGWTALGNAYPGVYYKAIDTAAEKGATVQHKVLVDDKVTVSEKITKEMMAEITNGEKPTLTFTAYAIQLKNTNAEGAATWDAATAWAAISG